MNLDFASEARHTRRTLALVRCRCCNLTRRLHAFNGHRSWQCLESDRKLSEHCRRFEHAGSRILSRSRQRDLVNYRKGSQDRGTFEFNRRWNS